MNDVSLKDKHIAKTNKTSYSLEAFLQACKKRKVNITRGARDRASKELGLHSTSDILLFLSSSGMYTELRFENTKEWENNPNSLVPVMVDAYTFLSDHKRCYFAFMYIRSTDSWMLKSLHISEESNSIMLEAFAKFSKEKKS